MNHWNTIQTAAEIEARFADIAKLDMNFAAKERAFYSTRTLAQLRVLAAQAWDCNSSESYMLARSFAALTA